MQIRISHWLVSLIIVGALLVGGCTSQGGSPQTSENSSTTTPVSITQANNPQMNNLPRLEGKATVVMVVNGSPITIEVDGTNAPVTAGNFVDLVQRGVYDGSVFHRVEKNFVVQGGDPQSKDPNFRGQLGTGGFIDPETKQPRNIPLEIKPQGADTPVYSKTFESARISQPPVLDHKRGAVAMARSMFPDSASSQFYFALSDINFLDGNYAVFGYVTQGMDVVDKIAIGNKIESAKVTQGAENLKK
ncbi:peptidylprolyl isomerase [Phormidium sp. LEGE 05292]|uniref:peptidylprolyl isomerase n=1 Tax=[Phormidium] sp. LEGE 05292 TaxID=767427 RepID=UPI00187E1C8C|nr:peptidylprolyl isomerase [Phormidium sp. LEGE 05292]MBE9230070.1 peptidylprolyl isomerase [Phormidium sp. LEGE 05292]